MTEPRPAQLQTLPEPQTEFVFTVSGSGGWTVALFVIAAALVAAAFWWWRRRRR